MKLVKEKRMKRMLCGLVAMAFVFSTAFAGEKEAKKVDLKGLLKIEKDGDKVKSATLTVACKAGCKGCDKDVAYEVTGKNEEVTKKLAELDGKEVEIKGEAAEKEGKKTLTADAVKEVKENGKKTK